MRGPGMLTTRPERTRERYSLTMIRRSIPHSRNFKEPEAVCLRQRLNRRR